MSKKGVKGSTRPKRYCIYCGTLIKSGLTCVGHRDLLELDRV